MTELSLNFDSDFAVCIEAGACKEQCGTCQLSCIILCDVCGRHLLFEGNFKDKLM